jgi:hypothetical protein
MGSVIGFQHLEKIERMVTIAVEKEGTRRFLLLRGIVVIIAHPCLYRGHDCSWWSQTEC